MNRRNSRNRLRRRNRANRYHSQAERSPKPASAVRHPGLIAGLFRWFGFVLLAICSVGAIALGAYALELDQTIRSKFAGKRWALPARVYARPLELFQGIELSAEQFAEELSLLPYRAVEQAQRPGTYTRRQQTFEIYTRRFTFWDGIEPSRRVRLTFNDNTLSTISSLDEQPTPALMRMEPIEIAGIYPAHGEDRVLVRRQEIPQLMIDTLIAVEDRSFYQHLGIDLRGISRAMLANLRAGRLVQGGSTLTQQLVKNFFLSSERRIRRKLNEMMMALLVELHYGKDEILEAYANEIYLGQDGNRAIHGFGLASRFFFDRTLAELEIHHIALLVGLVQGPSKYDPRRAPEQAMQRRAIVLDIMRQQNLISAQEAAQAKQQPLDITPKVPSANSRYPAFLDLVRQQLRENYREEDLTSEGLRVFTTLDPQVQGKAERAMGETIPKLEKKVGLTQGLLQAAAVVTDTQTGEVHAVIGGRDAQLAGFNRAVKAQRPAGSLLKPAVYLTALEYPEYYTLATLLDDANPLVYTTRDGKRWEPKNYDKRYHGHVMLRDALAKSYNIPTARLGLDLDVTRVIRTLQRLGLKRDIKPYPSLVLGAVDLSPFEITQIYASLASGGYQLPLRAITEVVAASGKPLPRLYSLTLKKAVDPGPAYLISSALQRVVTTGTAKAVAKIFPKSLGLAGKTGTTDDLRDSWFAGFSGNLLTVVWVGRDDNKPAKLSGAKGALPVWIEIMRNLPLQPFVPHQPADIEQILIDPDSGRLADANCRGAQWVPFLVGSMPRSYAPCSAGYHYNYNESSNYDRYNNANDNVNDNPNYDRGSENSTSTSSSPTENDSIGTFFRRLLE
jgi:penicillin-binding protein 1B